jgi:hypothetical protein
MSNYSSSYNINQAGDIYAIDTKTNRSELSKYTSSRATTINAPVNYRKLMLFRGYDNEFFFFVKSQNGKVFDLRGMRITASIINRHNMNKVLSEDCQVMDYETGLIKLVVRSNKISTLENGDVDVVLSYTDQNGLTKPLFSDLNMRPAFTAECTDKAGYIPLNTQVFENFLENNGIFYTGAMQGPAYYEKPNGLITIGVYATNFTGDFFMQGTTSPQPADDDWFNVELGVQYYYHNFIGFTGIEPFSFQSNLKHLRGKYIPSANNTGTVDKIVVRV